jgi:mannose-6-phosphate isomerase-like protein (cupin superfamily)
MPDDVETIIDLALEARLNHAEGNRSVAQVNDHEVRIAVMTRPYHWHRHPDSDETFLALEGGLFIDLDDQTIELQPGNMFTVMRGVRHRTRPVADRSVNLTFERSSTVSELMPDPNS